MCVNCTRYFSLCVLIASVFPISLMAGLGKEGSQSKELPSINLGQNSHMALIHFCKSLPKVELHAHLGGSVRPETLQDDSVKIPRDLDGVPVEPTGYCGFKTVKKFLCNDTAIQRVTREYFEDCCEDGIVYVELRTGGESRHKLEVILDVMDEFNLKERLPISRLIVSIKREEGVEKAWAAVRNAAELQKRGVIGIDFCGTETVNYPFREAFAEVVRWGVSQGLRFVPHFAEFPGESDLADILKENPFRLGHALALPPDIKEEIIRLKIPIEACVASNLNVMRRDRVIPKASFDLPNPTAVLRQYHPITEWIQKDHPIVLCCDNIGLLGVKLSEIYAWVAELGGPSEEEKKGLAYKLALNSVQAIGADAETKKKVEAITKAFLETL